jgi:hypothetical protein
MYHTLFALLIVREIFTLHFPRPKHKYVICFVLRGLPPTRPHPALYWEQVAVFGLLSIFDGRLGGVGWAGAWWPLEGSGDGAVVGKSARVQTLWPLFEC